MSRHTPSLHAPWYADPADGTVLHRYLDAEFVPRFLQEAQSGRLKRNADQAWRAEDRFGGRSDYPTLRLPVHRAFYVASCEASCETFGLPALDPARIRSAGLVVRRGRAPGSALRWMLKEGVPIGWWAGDPGESEPCDCRRLRQLGLIPERYPEPAYSGEETYPMHPLFLHVRGADGISRSHTLLWGYLPLGGQVRVDGPPSGENLALPDFSREHQWPFGTGSSIGSTSTPAAWTRADGYQVREGWAQKPFRQLLATLLGRYRITDASNPANTELRQLLSTISFQTSPLHVRRVRTVTSFDELLPGVSTSEYYYAPIEAADLGYPGNPVFDPERQRTDLLSYLDRRADQLLECLSRLDRGEDRALPAYEPEAAEPLASEAELPRLPWSLYLDNAQAASLRELLAMRARAELEVSDVGTAVPRFGQDEDDVYLALPFLRYHDEKGCERIAWGPPSSPFRVASPLSPQAQRPSLIVLPGLSELKLGGPRGVTFVAPKSLADKIMKLKFDMDLKTDGPGNPAGSCFGFSFSLPVITLCALIVLMVAINLLNLIFWWLPFAFMALPRLCVRALAKSAPNAEGGN